MSAHAESESIERAKLEEQLNVTREELEARIAEIEADTRFQAPPANVVINAALALVQVEMKGELAGLRRALADLQAGKEDPDEL